MGLRTYRFRLLPSMVVLFAALAMAAGCRLGPWSLWHSYATRFIDPQGRVIDPQGMDRTTSEGQAYALFFALADNDRPTFDKVLTWTQANMAEGDLQTHLPGWIWGKDKDGSWKSLDANSASDADTWMAYSLVEAGRLWSYPAYADLGRRMMAQIAATEVAEVPGLGTVLLPGAVGFQHELPSKRQSWTLNPSYLPLFIFERFAVLDPAGPWQKIALGIPRLLQESACHGYAMDWVDYVPGQGFVPAPAHPGKDAQPPVGGYDAIRVYLWAGMIDAKNPRRSDVLGAVPAMSAYLADHDAPPEKISAQGVPLAQDGPVGFSAAVLPYLRALPQFERPSAKQTVRLGAQRDAASGLYGKDQAYYDQNLALFATGFLDGRFRFGTGGELKVEWTRS
jgi:endo-1,4-beta-D-glucanase Y